METLNSYNRNKRRGSMFGSHMRGPALDIVRTVRRTGSSYSKNSKDNMK